LAGLLTGLRTALAGLLTGLRTLARFLTTLASLAGLLSALTGLLLTRILTALTTLVRIIHDNLLEMEPIGKHTPIDICSLQDTGLSNVLAGVYGRYIEPSLVPPAAHSLTSSRDRDPSTLRRRTAPGVRR